MFVIQCIKCGRKQVSDIGIDLYALASEESGYSIICECGNVVMDDEGHMHDGRMFYI